MKFVNACLNCGFMDTNKLENNCPICNSFFYKLNNKEGNKLIKLNKIQRIQWIENKIGHSIPEELNNLRENYNQNKIIEISKQKELEQSVNLNAVLEHGKSILEEQSNIPKCPTCSSTNIKKVSVTSKVANTALFGLFGTKRYKSFHCNNCGYEW